MGMDVYGKDAKNEKGEYFRRNVWGWRPLWNYCVDNYEDLVGEVSGHYNDGDGLDEAGSLELAKRIKTTWLVARQANTLTNATLIWRA